MTRYNDIISSFTAISDPAVRRDAATHLLKLLDEGAAIDGGAVRALYEAERDITVATGLKRLLNKLEIAKRLPNDPTTEYDRKLTVNEEKELAAEINRLRDIYDQVQQETGAFNRKYKVLEEIGRGGMARVLRGVRLFDNQPVAFKYLLLDQLAEQNNRERLIARFKREGELCVNRLNHPHIIKGYEYGEAYGNHFIVLEYLPDGTLENKLKSCPFSLAVFKDVSLQLCEAVDYLHRNGIIHRDIKPANTMLVAVRNAGSPETLSMGTPSIKLADFGLARDLRDNKLSTLRYHGGTEDYSSPQQLEDTRTADQRDDIFSMGKVFYQMLTCVTFGNSAAYVPLSIVIAKRVRTRGNDGADLEAGREVSADTKVVPPTRLREEEDRLEELDSVIKRCIAEERRDRWQSVRDLAKALREVFREK